MRILIDECVNPRVKQAFKGHNAMTVIEMDWRGIGNGELLALAEANQFDVFVTVDQNLEYQQNIAARKLGLWWCMSRITTSSFTNRSLRGCVRLWKRSNQDI